MLGLHAKAQGRQDVDNRLIVAEQYYNPDVSIYEPVCKNNPPTCATLYQVAKHTKDREQKTVMKADINVLRMRILFYQAGRPVEQKHELLPVTVSLVEMNSTLRTRNKP